MAGKWEGVGVWPVALDPHGGHPSPLSPSPSHCFLLPLCCRLLHVHSFAQRPGFRSPSPGPAAFLSFAPSLFTLVHPLARLRSSAYTLQGHQSPAPFHCSAPCSCSLARGHPSPRSPLSPFAFALLPSAAPPPAARSLPLSLALPPLCVPSAFLLPPLFTLRLVAHVALFMHCLCSFFGFRLSSLGLLCCLFVLSSCLPSFVRCSFVRSAAPLARAPKLLSSLAPLRHPGTARKLLAPRHGTHFAMVLVHASLLCWLCVFMFCFAFVLCVSFLWCALSCFRAYLRWVVFGFPACRCPNLFYVLEHGTPAPIF